MSAIKLKNKIYIVFIAIVLIVIAIVAILLINNSTSTVVITNDKEEKVMNTNALTMMYETEAGSGEYQVTSDTTWPQDGYIFNEKLSGCENGSTLTWDDERKAVILSTNVSDKCYVYFDKEPEIVYFADYIIDNVYVEDGVNGLYYHDGVGTYTNADQEAGDYSYRYSGANPNNYVCFGSDATTCLSDNLYRIIGVFGNEVKLIKWDYANSDLLGTDGSLIRDSYAAIDYPNYTGKHNVINRFMWNSIGYTNWESELNINDLNINYINYLNKENSKWGNMIKYTDWKLTAFGGDLDPVLSSLTIKNLYQYFQQGSSTYNAKIGLMYVSDYGYAASSENWLSTLSDYNADINRNNNWIFMGVPEWTITPTKYDETTGWAFGINNDGSVGTNRSENGNAVRPVFYLNPDVVYISGSGTESDPFRIA